MKKISSFLFLSLSAFLCFSFSILTLNGGIVKKHDFFIISFDHYETIHIKVCDIVQINSKAFPLIPKNRNKTFKVQYDEEYLYLIASNPVRSLGSIGREIYIKAIKSGIAQAKVILFEEETVIEEFVFSFKIE